MKSRITYVRTFIHLFFDKSKIEQIVKIKQQWRQLQGFLNRIDVHKELCDCKYIHIITLVLNDIWINFEIWNRSHQSKKANRTCESKLFQRMWNWFLYCIQLSINLYETIQDNKTSTFVHALHTRPRESHILTEPGHTASRRITDSQKQFKHQFTHKQISSHAWNKLKTSEIARCRQMAQRENAPRNNHNAITSIHKKQYNCIYWYQFSN